jgi:hypothetical protein
VVGALVLRSAATTGSITGIDPATVQAGIDTNVKFIGGEEEGYVAFVPGKGCMCLPLSAQHLSPPRATA